MCKVRDWYAPFGDTGMNHAGIKVIGPNISDGSITCWHFDTEEYAKTFADQLCRETGETVLIVNILGRYRPAQLPVEYIATEKK